MDKVSYITSEGLKKLVAEVEYLKSVERPRISTYPAGKDFP